MATTLDTIQFGGDGKDVILSLINQKENLNLVASDFIFSHPIVPSDQAPVRNTKVFLTPVARSGYYGVKTVWYNRVHVLELGNINVPKGTATRVSDLLHAINIKYGIIINEFDIIDNELGAADSTGVTIVNLVFHPNSYVFYGGGVITTYAENAGVLISQHCVGTSLYGTYTNGVGGTYVALIKDESPVCGFVEELSPVTIAAIASAIDNEAQLRTIADTHEQDLDEKDELGGYVGLTNFDINIQNQDGSVTSVIKSVATEPREYTFPNKNIEVAGLDDIVNLINTNASRANSDILQVLVDGQTEFILQFAPTNVSNVTLTVNGLKYAYGMTNDFIIDGVTLTWSDLSLVLDTTDVIIISYTY